MKVIRAKSYQSVKMTYKEENFFEESLYDIEYERLDSAIYVTCKRSKATTVVPLTNVQWFHLAPLMEEVIPEPKPVIVAAPIAKPLAKPVSKK